jgi:hypothetical protein
MIIRKYKIIFILLLLAGTLPCFDVDASAAELNAEAVVEETSVYVGETFIFQIRVTGSDKAVKPDLSRLNGFTIEYQGGSQNNSTSITVINGKMTRNIRRGYVFHTA